MGVRVDVGLLVVRVHSGRLRGRNLSHASSRGTAMADAGSGTVRRGVETQQRQW